MSDQDKMLECFNTLEYIMDVLKVSGYVCDFVRGLYFESQILPLLKFRDETANKEIDLKACMECKIYSVSFLYEKFWITYCNAVVPPMGNGISFSAN